MSHWTIDLSKQVSIIIGDELGKTETLYDLYRRFARHSSKLLGNAVLIQCNTPVIIGLGRGQSRLTKIYQGLDELLDNKTNKYQNYLLVDDIEEGLSTLQQKSLITSMLDYSKNKVNIICVTHNPIVYYHEGWIDCVIKCDEK